MNYLFDKKALEITRKLTFILVTIFLISVSCSDEKQAQQSSSVSTMEEVEGVIDSIHIETGLVYADGFELVRSQCTACHSAQLITQNRATREGWEQMIRWMQETQGLWQLGEKEAPILDYLATHYAPEKNGRRANLDVEAIEWYILETEDLIE